MYFKQVVVALQFMSLITHKIATHVHMFVYYYASSALLNTFTYTPVTYL